MDYSANELKKKSIGHTKRYKNIQVQIEDKKLNILNEANEKIVSQRMRKIEWKHKNRRLKRKKWKLKWELDLTHYSLKFYNGSDYDVFRQHVNRCCNSSSEPSTHTAMATQNNGSENDVQTGGEPKPMPKDNAKPLDENSKPIIENLNERITEAKAARDLAVNKADKARKVAVDEADKARNKGVNGHVRKN